MRNIVRSSLAAAGAAGVLAMSSAVPATAAVPENEHMVNAGSEVIDNFCGSGIDFNHVFHYRTSSMVKTHGPGTPLYFADHFSGSQTFTNLETDKSFSVSNHGTFRDQRITVNADGTLTIVQQFSGNQIVRDDANRILFKDTGVIRFEAVVDYNGTLNNADDDTLVEDRGIIFQHGNNDTAERDFCADVLQFTAA